MTDRSPEVWRLEASRAMAVNGVAQALSTTGSLADAEAALLTMTDRSEIGYARAKADDSRRDSHLDLEEALRRLPGQLRSCDQFLFVVASTRRSCG